MRAYVSIHDYDGVHSVPTDVIITLPEGYDLSKDATNVRNRFIELRTAIAAQFAKVDSHNVFSWAGGIVIGGVTLLPDTPYEDFRNRIRDLVPEDISEDDVDEIAHRLIDEYIDASDKELQTALKFI